MAGPDLAWRPELFNLVPNISWYLFGQFVRNLESDSIRLSVKSAWNFSFRSDQWSFSLLSFFFNISLGSAWCLTGIKLQTSSAACCFDIISGPNSAASKLLGPVLRTRTGAGARAVRIAALLLVRFIQLLCYCFRVIC